MKKSLLITLLLFCVLGKTLNAQVGMINNSPHKSAILDMKATSNKGVLIPNVSLNTNVDVSSIIGNAPAPSLLVYNTNVTILNSGSAGSGYYFWDTNIWKKMITKTDVIGDNLGNYSATKSLDMTTKNILNIKNTYVKNNVEILDRTVANTNYFTVYKNNGFFRILGTKTGVDHFVIDENIGKVGAGTVNPKNNFSVSGGPISQDDFGDGNKYLLMGVTGASKITQNSGWNFTNYAGQITDANNVAVSNQTGVFAWYTADNGAWVEKMRLANDGSLNFSGALKIGTLPLGTFTESNLSVDIAGNVHRTSPTKSIYYTSNLAPGASQTITLTSTAAYSRIIVTSGNGCGRVSIASFIRSDKIIVFKGGQARNILYIATPIGNGGTSYQLAANGVAGCGDGGGATQFNFDIAITPTTIIITNRGNIIKGYTITETVF